MHIYSVYEYPAKKKQPWFSAMKCGRNKATAIICDLADITKTTLAERMRTGPFTVSTDGSNDDMSKQFPLVVRTLDPSTLTVNSELLSIPVCNEAATGILNKQIIKV